MSPRRLPLLLERDLHEVQAEKLERSDAFVAGLRSRGLAMSCSSGCSNCCLHPVMISLLEGLQLFRWLAERGEWTAELRTNLYKHAKQTWGLAQEMWFLSAIPCPFLDTDKCAIYEGRPFVCRMTWSVSDPADCHPHHFGPRTGIVPRAEEVEDFHRLEARKLREHGLVAVQLPISKAVLVAEEIVSGKLALEAVGPALAKEYGDIV